MSGLVIVRTRAGGIRPVPAGSIRVNAVRMRTALVSGRSGEPFPGAGLSFKGVLAAGAKIGIGLLTGGPAGAVGAAAGLLSGGSKPTGSPPPLAEPMMPAMPPVPATGFTAPGCPEGFRLNPNTGVCEKAGFGGVFERAFPGGRTGTLAPSGTGVFGLPTGGSGGQVVVGSFGIPAAVPVQVGTIQRRDGSQAPILRCGRGLVLGKDDLCYPRSILGARGQFRKHPADRRPPVTATDAAAIRRAASAQKRVKKLAQSVGLRTSSRSSSRAAAPKRKR